MPSCSLTAAATGFFNSFFSSSQATDTVSPLAFILSLLTAFGTGIFLALIYLKTNRGRSNNQGFALTIAALPAILAIIILLIGSNVARAFSLAGAFSIIRFRSAPGDPRDIAQVLLALAVGLACGMGYLGYAVVFALFISLILLLLYILRFGQNSPGSQHLIRILVPEDISYTDTLEPVISRYTTRFELIKIKTVELGSLYELTYRVTLQPNAQPRQLLDELRCENSNLNIQLSVDSTADVAVS